MATLLLLVSSALATTVTREWCVSVDINYTDIASGDHWPVDEDKPARGFYYEVWNTPPGLPATLHSQGSLAIDGATPGCSGPVPLTQYNEYQFKVFSYAATTASLDVWAYDEILDPDLAVWSGSVFTALADATSFPVLPGTTDNRWNHLALAVFAIGRHAMGLTSGNIFLYENSSAVDEATGAVGLATDSTYKFVVASKLGELLSQYRDHDVDGDALLEQGCVFDTSPDDDCDGSRTAATGLLRKTFMSEAGCHGVAAFYSAVTWNAITAGGGQDCHFRAPYDLDWDEDGIWADQPTNTDFLCHGDPWSGGFPNPDGTDWLEKVVAETDGGSDGECGGILENRGTSYDWLTYFWDMVTVQGVTLPVMWTIWDGADGKDWNVSDLGPGGFMPVTRMRDAADAEGRLTEHEAADDHGLDYLVH